MSQFSLPGDPYLPPGVTDRDIEREFGAEDPRPGPLEAQAGEIEDWLCIMDKGLQAGVGADDPRDYLVRARNQIHRAKAELRKLIEKLSDLEA